jgi:hypothetical protein
VTTAFKADAAVEKVGFEGGLNREQLKAALKYAREHKWIAETNKATYGRTAAQDLSVHLRHDCDCSAPR